MGFLDWYFGRTSQKTGDRKVVLNLEDKLRETLKSADKCIQNGEDEIARDFLKIAIVLRNTRNLEGYYSKELDGYCDRVIADYIDRFPRN